MTPDVCGGVREAPKRSGNRKETVGTRDSGGDSVTSARASDRRKRKVDFMKQNRIVLGVAALVAAVMLPWPALGQEVGQQTVPGKESPAEKTAEKESEKPADKAAEHQASDKKTDGDWGFRWDGRPSLHLGEGTRVDFRVRLQQRDLALGRDPVPGRRLRCRQRQRPQCRCRSPAHRHRGRDPQHLRLPGRARAHGQPRSLARRLSELQAVPASRR